MWWKFIDDKGRVLAEVWYPIGCTAWDVWQGEHHNYPNAVAVEASDDPNMYWP